MTIPSWLLEPSKPIKASGRGLKRTAADKASKEARVFLSDFFQGTGDAAWGGFLQRVDPRIKIIGLVGILIALSATKTLDVIFGVYALILILVLFSGLQTLVFLRRTLLPAAFFTLPFVLPATLNIVTPGRSVVSLISLSSQLKIAGLVFPSKLAVTDTGLVVGAIFFARALTMLSATTLMIRTTPVDKALASLAALGLPNFAVATLRMAYRYLFILVDLVDNIYMAKKSRTIRTGAKRTERQWASGRIVWTFRRSMDLSDDVTMAMISRGWSGEYRSLPLPALTRYDWLAAGCLVMFGIVLTAAII